ncbi:FAD-dependent monooxygenase [Pseudoalteromonas sp. BDTF-M6]|uniref:FAD-dependent monooxygenase n=1 Tax=Pseudoalteromonas sp. BDTF-M6 TaxID=2796132 RepID=UPI001BAF505C|nr:FAD-dependent monooxygenase [Pseudoalteromonas sp. BDTF-M6]MBS3797547.1 FAD-dependent monooxygenase [Pseudoalteromonas sp. BDTF-M6]
MSAQQPIAVVGAGIAGMAFAIAAAQHGYKVSLFERGEHITSMGAGVTLWPNAMWVLQRLGLAADILQAGGQPQAMRQFDQQGIQQGEFDISAVNRFCEHASVTILRRDLVRILASKVAQLGVKIHFNSNISAADIPALKQQYALVVGADGRMHSAVRAHLYPGQQLYRYQHFVNVIGISRSPSLGLDPVIADYRGDGERFGIVPINAELCFWAAGWHAKEVCHSTPEQWLTQLQQRFQHWATAIHAVLNTREKSSVKGIHVHDIDPLPYWHQDNVVLTGDAAHAPLPTSGQGACQALEDAWHLSLLVRSDGPLSERLAAFYQKRIDKTSLAQAIGRNVAAAIFSPMEQSAPATFSADAKQLSQLWMQGLSE